MGAGRPSYGSGHVDEARLRTAEGDLREFLRLADDMGELTEVRGADADGEIGALFELSLERRHPPVLLFDEIKGYRPGYRVLVNVQEARVFNPETGLAAVKALRRRRGERPVPIEPEEVTRGPVLENVMRGDDIHVLAFPAPRWHAQDGGAYIGTQCLVITRDPDSDWVNVGTYRAQVQDDRTISVFIEPGKHGDVHRRKYWASGEACPMVLSVGQAPVLSAVAGSPSRDGESELATAGGRLGRPITFIRGPMTGLPIPSDAELVFEGVMPPPEVEVRDEGPFGEWPGYYASAERAEPVLRVQAIYHRNDPIITGEPPAKPTYPGRMWSPIAKAAATWDALEAAGVPGIKGVWKMVGGGTRFITVVAIEQQHAGHAKMAGLVATGCGPAAYLGRMVIIVDDDIDITDPAEVNWALATRWDPKSGTDVIDGCWTGYIDPLLDPYKREIGDITNSRAIIYAVRPYHWRERFPPVNMIERTYAADVRARWADRLPYLRDGQNESR
jgi:UbiD family decarboxylase